MKMLAAIQAGGRSRRMGTDKAWLELAGQPMIERLIAAAQPLAQRLLIVISQDTPNRERYETLAAKWQADLLIDAYEYCGPLGGIATALRHCAAEEAALILACDLPLLSSELLQLLLTAHAALPTAQLTVAEDQAGRLQMLCGIYETACLPPAEHLLAEKRLRVDGLCQLVTTQRLRWTDYAHLPEAGRILMNCNTPDELHSALR